MSQTNDDFLETAWNIGCQLMKTAIWHEKSCNWQGYSIEPLNGSFQPVIRTFGPDVYSGTSGIALFLASLYSEREDEILLKTIEGCIEQIKSTVSISSNHGFYAGKPGIATALIKIGSQLNRKDWVHEGVEVLNTIPTSPLLSHEIDVISGVAGTIPIFIDAYKLFNKKEFLDKAVILGHQLCDLALKNNSAWSWETVPSKKNLTGFSHGSSGIALALLQLYEATGEPLFLVGSEGGFNYERQSFDSKQQNWPDFRDDVVSKLNENICGLAWCHGAPGIALSRIKANKLKPNVMFSNEISISLKTTANNIYHSLLENTNNTNFSLCHGIAGNSDVLLELENEGSEYEQLAQAVGKSGISKYQDNNISWPTGLNTGQYTPGLMMGIAGTGYFYLRLHDRKKHKTLLMPAL